PTNSLRDASFRPWRARMAANACYYELRRRRSRPAVSLDQPVHPDELPLEIASGEPTPDERAEQHQLARLIQHALSQLPPDQRLAIILCDVQGFDYAEIAQATDASMGTVKSRISRGRSHLRALLRAGGELLPARLRQVSAG